MRAVRSISIAAVAGLVLALAACGSDSDTDGVASGSTSGSGQSAGVEEAQEYIEEYLQPPTDIYLDVPLSRKPDTGKKIISLSNATPSNFAVEAGMKQAAESLGWTFSTVPIPSGTEGIIQAFTAALEQNPDGIRVSGQPRALYESQLAEAERRGIAVVQDSATDAPGGGLLNTTIANKQQTEFFGELMANWVIADSGGAAKIALFSIPQFPALTANAEAFSRTITEKCPDCEVEVVDQQLADIGVNTPRSAVSTLQRSPDTGYLVFTLGDLSNGVAPALRSAGVDSGSVKLVGSVPTAENLTSLANGGEGAWTSFASPVVGWRVIDVFARIFNDESLEPVEDNPLFPTQVLTKDNVDTVVTDPDADDWYVGVKDYKDQFKQLWQVS